MGRKTFKKSSSHWLGNLKKDFFVFLGELCEAVARDRVDRLKIVDVAWGIF